MLNTATSVAPAPPAAPAPPGSAAPAPDTGAATAFARLLGKTQVEQASSGDGGTPDPAVQPPAADGKPAGSRKVDAAKSQAEGRADARGASTDAPSDEPVSATPTRAEDGAPAEDDAQPPAELLAWVASLPLPPPAAARAQAARANTAAPKDDAPLASASAALPQGAASLRAEVPTPSSPASDAGGNPRVEGDWAQTLAAQREGGGAPSAKPGIDNALSLAALSGMAASPPSKPLDGGAPLQAELRAEVGSREFAPALGSQLSVLVRNGIEHAQLKLNPAEMGPIEVRIRIDGSQAQVDFSAAQAHTRQALQEAVPALASALRDSGLTLTGGGVFEQPRESRGQASPADDRQAQPAAQRGAGELLPAATSRTPRARGVLDLYA